MINLYEKCGANKMVNGKKCTVLWHDHGMMISHVDTAIVGDIIERLDERYGNNAPLNMARGKVHQYLGMTIEYLIEGKFRIRMDYYVDNLLSNVREYMGGVASSPSS